MFPPNQTQKNENNLRIETKPVFCIQKKEHRFKERERERESTHKMRHTNLHLNISSINNIPKLQLDHSFNSSTKSATKKNQQQLI